MSYGWMSVRTRRLLFGFLVAAPLACQAPVEDPSPFALRVELAGESAGAVMNAKLKGVERTLWLGKAHHFHLSEADLVHWVQGTTSIMYSIAENEQREFFNFTEGVAPGKVGVEIAGRIVELLEIKRGLPATGLIHGEMPGFSLQEAQELVATLRMAIPQ